MPGRNDFAIIRARLFADERTHAAARLYVAAGLAAEPTAVAAVVGHIAALGVWAIRETDDGVLPGTGSIPLAGTAFLSMGDASKAVTALADAGFLKSGTSCGSVYLAGFRDAYGSLMRERETARKRAAARRRFGERSPNVRRRFADGSTQPYRTKDGTTVGRKGAELAKARIVARPETIRKVIEEAKAATSGRKQVGG
jgi:hypothetical protein